MKFSVNVIYFASCCIVVAPILLLAVSAISIRLIASYDNADDADELQPEIRQPLRRRIVWGGIPLKIEISNNVTSMCFVVLSSVVFIGSCWTSLFLNYYERDKPGQRGQHNAEDIILPNQDAEKVDGTEMEN